MCEDCDEEFHGGDLRSAAGRNSEHGAVRRGPEVRKEGRSGHAEAVDYRDWIGLGGMERHEYVAPSTETATAKVKSESFFLHSFLYQGSRHLEVFDCLLKIFC